MIRLSKYKLQCAVFLLLTTTSVTIHAQSFKTLATFHGRNGSFPTSPLVQGTDGNLYGVTQDGGRNSAGTAFKMTPEGKIVTLHAFCSDTACADGKQPVGLTLGADGNFYGVNNLGGAIGFGYGTIFKMTPEGKVTTLHTFCSKTNCADGAAPTGPMYLAADGNFYGTTIFGGTTNGGTFFKISPEGKLTTLYTFCSQTNCADGSEPYAPPVQGVDGNFYGTTFVGGGLGNDGVVYKITPKGDVTTLYNFCSLTGCADGYHPVVALIQGADKNLYGTTPIGATNPGGTAFQITPAGKFTILHTFCKMTSCLDGGTPNGLLQATDGEFYGTATFGGSHKLYGTVYKMMSTGNVTVLHNFDGTGGRYPFTGLMQATDGNFYGSTAFGGDRKNCLVGCGTIFHLSTGLGPFVTTVPISGKRTSNVLILGTNLTGVSSVTFNGVAAKFEVASKSEIKTTVPANATTGKVKIKTANGTLVSNVDFRVAH